ncbi:fungal-specific transcription factor domain-containing protein [Blakeslea trispora]|nr:fungal-specific transcription factor domain-containing protein [Blakeslea trispora]
MSGIEQNDQNKRKRLTTACNICRRKKIKCDGIQPTCGKCAKFNLECTYTTVMKKRGPRQGHMDSIEKRLRKMEEMIRGNNSGASLSPSSQPSQIPLPPPSLPEVPTTLSESILLPPLSNSISTSNITSATPIQEQLHNPQEENPWPSTDIIDHLLPLFLNHLELYSPIVKINDLLQSIQNKTCNLFLLLSILSLAARFSDRPDLVACPRWLSGERFSNQARKMLTDVIETPCIEHVQGLLLLMIHEYGCARGPRIWRYSALAIRMALELNLHKELVIEQEITTMSLDTWFWYETRRKVLWETFSEDKIVSATTGKPQMLNADDINTLLPIWHTSLDLNAVETLYQPSFDRTRLVRYTAIRDPSSRQTTGFYVSLVDLSIPTHLPYLSQVELSSRLIEQMVMMGKICDLISRGYTTYISSTATAKIDEGVLKIEQLNKELDDWYSRLPLSLRYTPANLDQFRYQNSYKASQFILIHVLHNGLMVLLNRPTLALTEISKLKSTSPLTQEFVHRSTERCNAAADNVAVMLKDLSSSKFAPSLPAYFVYITATAIVSNIFSDCVIASKQSEAALDEFYHYFETMKVNWAMTDKLLFLIHDLYAVHQKAFSTRQDKSTSAPKPSLGRMIPLNDIPAVQSDYNGSQWPVSNEAVFSFMPNRINTNVSSFDTWLQEQQLLQRKQ